MGLEKGIRRETQIKGFYQQALKTPLSPLARHGQDPCSIPLRGEGGDI